MNPFLILGVPASAGDAEIRRAYLEAIHKYPPENEPERFQAIAGAYEKIRDEKSRLNYVLFDEEAPGSSPYDVFAKYCLARQVDKPLDFEAMKTFLRSCTTT
jgi:curved DNA-binding protein CbpA